MDINLTQKTKLVAGQQMQTSLNFLQMGTLELEERLREISMENIMLEETEPPRMDPLPLHGTARTPLADSDDDFDEMPIPDKQHKTLKASLQDQLNFSSHPSRLTRAIDFLILNLDEHGYLPADICMSNEWKKQETLYQEALEHLQQMDPAGVGARDLRECLLLQLKRSKEEDSVAAKICENYLDQLGKHHFNYIAGALGISEAQVQEAMLRIRMLSPFPANGFDDGHDTVYIRPDVEVVLENDDLAVRSLDEYLPHYAINTYYVSLLSSEDITQEEEKYLQEKYREAKWILSCVRRRSETTLLCAKAIVQRQKPFFLDNFESLSPCSMTDIADELGIHPSTVSRAVRDKYFLCNRGIVPMSDFFRHEISGNTADDLAQKIQEIIASEDVYHPLSDNAISEKLAQQGYDVARRTVAKYREAAAIPPATGRKKRI